MSRDVECTQCAGTGQEMYLGTGTWGATYAGACSRCHGKGQVLDVPTPATTHVRGKDGIWYATQHQADEAWAQYQREAAEDRAAAADRADWIEAHQHYL